MEEDLDTSTLEILEKARRRQEEMQKEKEYQKENDVNFASTPGASSSTPSTPSSMSMKDKFAKLSSNIDDFVCEIRHSPLKQQEITHGPLESTCIAGSTGSRQYAQFHFSGNSTPKVSANSTSSAKISPITAEEPFYDGEPSPIVRPPSDDEEDYAVFDDSKDTKTEKGESTLTEAENSAATVITVKAKSIAQQFEERSRQVTATSTPPVARKPTKFPTTALPRAVQQQQNIPKPTVAAGPNPNIEDKKIGSVKSLMSRWEVSSLTGAPLHPDQKDLELLSSAVAMAKSINRPKFPGFKVQKSKPVNREEPQPTPSASEASEPVAEPVVVASAISQTKQAELEEMEATDSPCHKSPRLNISHTSVHDSSTATACAPEEVVEEDDLIDDDASDSECETETLPKELEEDSYIDKAFGFMDGSPYKSSGSGRPAPLAEGEVFGTPRTDNESLLEAINTDVRLRTFDTARSHTQNEEPTTPSLAHSISFFRKRRAEVKTPSSRVITIGGTPKTSLEALKEEERASPEQDTRVQHAMLKRIEESIAVEEEHIKQATRAFAHCRDTPEFRGSREEVDAQRALLISQERRKTLMAERERLMKNPKETRLSGPRGSLVISEMTFRLTRDFVNGHINATHNDGMLYYFIALIKYDDVVEHTAMVTSDDGLRSGHIDFSHYLQLKRLRPDFKIRLEIHGLKTQREIISHHEKYRSRRGSQSKGSKQKAFSSSQPSSLCMSLTGFITSPGGPRSVIDAAFQKLGHLTLDINLVKQQKFALVDAHYPLDGSAQIKMRSYAEESRAVNHRGFVSLYETIQGLGSWNRLWCSLTDGKLRFWRYPEDEDVKETYCEFDMRWCVNEVVPTPEDIKSFQYSMQMDMLVPNHDNKSDQIRVLLAADTKESMGVWVVALNKTIRNLLLWTGR